MVQQKVVRTTDEMTNKAHKLLIENVVTKKTNKSLKNFDTHTTGPVKEIQ